MLVGVNVPDALSPLEVATGNGMNQPYAVRTLLGWTCSGPLSHADDPQQRNQVHSLQAVRSQKGTTDDIKKALEKLYYVDLQSVHDFHTKGPSRDDMEWLRQVKSSITKTCTGQYQIHLPFRTDQQLRLRNNREQALQRLQSLRRKFESNHQFWEDYKAFMSKMETSGYVEEAIDITENKALYIPHHGVYHPRKPGKIRVVFNCANKFAGVSLNDCLYAGPDLTNSLVGVLLRLRRERVAFAADIDSMFYRVLVPPEQRDWLRYVWWPGGDVAKAPKTFRLKVHLFGAASSPSCANFALRQAVQQACDSGLVEADVLTAARECFYVDDCLVSVKDESTAARIAHGLIMACQTGGFRLAKFISSSVPLLQRLPETELGASMKGIDLMDSDPLDQVQERALGVAWYPSPDEFGFKVADIDASKSHITKRKILSILSAVYDPIGMAAPVAITARMLFRNLTKQQEIDWDQNVSPETTSAWHKWISELPALQEVRIPRCMRSRGETNNDWELHLFADASMEAYASVAYLRSIEPSEPSHDFHVAFVFGKARVSPPKVATVPRLELTAAKLATDIARSVQHELSSYSIVRRYFWTDSQTVLKYLRNKTRRFHTFVANRIHSILAETQEDEWRFVPSHLNAADEGTRGMEPQRLGTGSWLRGPGFLRQDRPHWPDQSFDLTIGESDPEIKRESSAMAIKTEQVTPFIEKMAAHYSSFYQLIKSLAVLMHFRQYLRNGRRRTWSAPPVLSIGDLRRSKMAALSWLQRETWPEEWVMLKQNEALPKKSILFKLSPRWCAESNVVWLNSRTHQRVPIVPPGRVAQLIVMEAHVNQAHLGRAATAAEVLRRFWPVGLGKIVRHVVRACPTCQRRKATPSTTEMAPLPLHCLERCQPFQTTGVDYFGPFQARKTQAKELQEQVKLYGVVFSCASTHAIHLEVSEDLSTNRFLNALRRFIARRGNVMRIISDNGTNLAGADNELKKELAKELARLRDQPTAVINALRQRGIEWVFNTPQASHHGGFWERMIRSVRNVLAASLESKQPLSYDNLHTWMCEAEAVLNNRPLTTLSEDPEDYQPLTPNHLLLGSAGPTPPPGNFNPGALSIRNHWRQVQHTANAFWRRWTQEYKTLLHCRAKWHGQSQRPLKVNDVVLVLDALKPREYWPLGRITEVYPSKYDAQVRSAQVLTKQGRLLRPITKLCMLETASIDSDS